MFLFILLLRSSRGDLILVSLDTFKGSAGSGCLRTQSARDAAEPKQHGWVKPGISAQTVISLESGATPSFMLEWGSG